MREATSLYTPEVLESILESIPIRPEAQSRPVVSVHNCSTLRAARLLIEEGVTNPLCLNFASATSPGGGFLRGAQAQEECLVRATGLYQSLTAGMPFYHANRSRLTALYTNHIIYSPMVPAFRADDNSTIAEPYHVSFVSSPAVNAFSMRMNEASKFGMIAEVMKTRIRLILAVARERSHKALVLGAWGCGAFENDPSDIASWFAEALFEDGRFAGAFDRIVFGVLDRNVDEGYPTFESFRKVFEN
jgi:uncharacterized protein (TIGR02452 family)